MRRNSAVTQKVTASPSGDAEAALKAKMLIGWKDDTHSGRIDHIREYQLCGIYITSSDTAIAGGVQLINIGTGINNNPAEVSEAQLKPE